MEEIKQSEAKGAAKMKINQSRIENGVEICNTCVKPVTAPYRSYSNYGTLNQQVSEGCVSSAHNGHVFDAWHTRKEVKAIQKALDYRA